MANLYVTNQLILFKKGSLGEKKHKLEEANMLFECNKETFFKAISIMKQASVH